MNVSILYIKRRSLSTKRLLTSTKFRKIVETIISQRRYVRMKNLFSRVYIIETSYRSSFFFNPNFGFQKIQTHKRVPSTNKLYVIRILARLIFFVLVESFFYNFLYYVNNFYTSYDILI